MTKQAARQVESDSRVPCTEMKAKKKATEDTIQTLKHPPLFFRYTRNRKLKQ